MKREFFAPAEKRTPAIQLAVSHATNDQEKIT
jgi:hypothetical protein